MKGFDLTAVLLNPEFAGMLLHGIWMTFVIALGSWLLAMTLGVVLLVIRLLPSRIADGAVAGYISYHRNVPTLVQLMLWYFGIASLLPGELQALSNAMPALVNHTVSLFKNSSLAMAIGVVELTQAVRQVENESFRTFETYMIATVAYLVCSLLIMAGGALLDQRMKASGAR